MGALPCRAGRRSTVGFRELTRIAGLASGTLGPQANLQGDPRYAPSGQGPVHDDQTGQQQRIEREMQDV